MMGSPARAALAFAAMLFCLAHAPVAAAVEPITIADPTGDAGGAPDVTSVRIEDNGAGSFLITTTLATMPDLQPDGIVVFYFDTDRNRAEGDPDTFGEDFRVAVAAEGGFVYHSQYRIVNGQSLPVPVPADHVRRLTRTGFQFSVSRADLGAAEFRLFVIAARDSSDIQDTVPDKPTYGFPGAIVRVQVPEAVRSPRAGRILDARTVEFVLSTNETIVRPKRTCTLAHRGRLIKPLAGGCRWRIAPRLKGKRLTLRVTIRYGGSSRRWTVPVLPR